MKAFICKVNVPLSAKKQSSKNKTTAPDEGAVVLVEYL
jgi:hypothetical protein